MSALDHLCHMTGAGSSARDRALYALKSLGYHVEKHRTTTAPMDGYSPISSYGHRTTYVAYFRPDERTLSIEVTQRGGASTEGDAWVAAAAHALAHYADRLPAPYSGPGTTWPLPGERR